MRHYKKMIDGFLKHKLIKKSLNELQRDHLYRVMVQFSSRIDFLEDFITSETDYDGEKVGLQKFGDKKEDWLKDGQRKGNTGSNKKD